MWLSAKVRSRPSAVMPRCMKMLPALLMSTSMRGSSAAIRSPTCRVSPRRDRSAMCALCAIVGPTLRSRASVRSARARSRATRTIRAPCAASASAATCPMPEVAPVMTMIMSDDGGQTTDDGRQTTDTLFMRPLSSVVRPLSSEIGLCGLRDRHCRQPQEGVRVLGADRLGQWPFLRGGQHRHGADRHLGHGRLELAEALDGVPRRREGARILDVEVRLQLLAALDQVQSLDDVQILGVRRPVAVDLRAVVDPDRVDDERIALVAADGFAVP